MGELSKPEDHKVAINALIRKRSEISGEIKDLERQTDQLRAELIHVDSVLRPLILISTWGKSTKPQSPRRSEILRMASCQGYALPKGAKAG